MPERAGHATRWRKESRCHRFFSMIIICSLNVNTRQSGKQAACTFSSGRCNLGATRLTRDFGQFAKLESSPPGRLANPTKGARTGRPRTVRYPLYVSRVGVLPADSDTCSCFLLYLFYFVFAAIRSFAVLVALSVHGRDSNGEKKAFRAAAVHVRATATSSSPSPTFGGHVPLGLEGDFLVFFPPSARSSSWVARPSTTRPASTARRQRASLDVPGI